uniref:Codanin-1_C domain-containing protein n=1 Tax=Anopheles atroparvus TaxID=41427 RepID=A0A182JE33_ANOAO
MLPFKYAAPAKCDTPKKVPSFEGEATVLLRKSSIIDGSDYAASGVPNNTSTPVAEGRSLGEPDTTGSPRGHLIARQLFDHGGPPNAGYDDDDKDGHWAGSTGTTPKRCPVQGPQVNGFSTPSTSHRQSAGGSLRLTGDAIYSTPPLPVANGARVGATMLSITSTPVHSRGKLSAQYGSSSRNGSLEVSHPSPSAANGSQFRSTEVSGTSDGGGRRSKTGSPCLGDFIVTHSMKSQKSVRRSPLTGGNLSSEPGGNSSSATHNSSIFHELDFPQLSVISTPQKDHTVEEDNAQGLKQRSSIVGRSEQPDATPTGKKAIIRRRIAPTTVSRTVSGRHDFTSSSLRSENNLVSIESVEEEATMHDPRGMLRHLKDEIRTDFEAEQAQLQRVVRAKHSLQSSFGQLEPISPSVEPLATQQAIGEPEGVELLVIEIGKVTQKATINRLVGVYTLLMDLNLVPNVLNELACLINLVSMERRIPLDATLNATDLSNVLRNPHNRVYFATEVLYRQRLLLALLDSTSLRVVVENEQLAALQPTLNRFLRDALDQKMKLEKASLQQAANSSDLLANSSITNVFYQQENDTKDNFPSVKEFGAFNKQRDSFYTILRIWETEHLSPNWEFETKLGPKVRAMLDILQHPINMAHLAKLFSAQLIISFNFDNSTSELQIALPSIDLAKLSKLRQRLVAPSIFSTQYLFPGSQTFYRDFIVASENHPMFIEQLKPVLIHELLQMNGSSYDIFSIGDEKCKNRTEYVVRPETIATMRVLAKFLGFIVARPFQYEGCRSTIVENRQIELRNTLLPLFDVKPIVLRSVVDRKLVITVPWLVQYLSMLDAVTLRLRYYEELFHMLRDIYQATALCGSSSNRHLFVVPTSKFIVRSCLDWLFDQANVPEEYFSSPRLLDGNPDGLVHVEQLAMQRFGVSEQLIETSSNVSIVANRRSSKTIEAPIVFNPLLETVLSAACPFLADFRVSVMPSKVEKVVSRSGRYRHITTRFSGAVTPQGTSANESSIMETGANVSSKSGGLSGHNHSKSGPANAQSRLVEAFLQSQSHSVRRIVEFIVERTTSAVIKDFQMMYLLPEKKAVTDQIVAVRGPNVHRVKQRIYAICNEALSGINGTWESNVPKMLNKRITDSLDALLPEETIVAVSMTCKDIALEKCLQKINEWRQSHMSDIELFCRNVQSEAESIMRSQQHSKDQQQQADKTASAGGNQTNLTISANSAIMPSVLYAKLQILVNYAASRPTLLTSDELAQWLAQTLIFLDDPEHTMTPSMDRMLGHMLLQLFLLLIKSRCDLSVPDLLQAAIKPILDRISGVINRVLHKNGHAKRPGHSIDDSQSEMFMELLSDLARDITDF